MLVLTDPSPATRSQCHASLLSSWVCSFVKVKAIGNLVIVGQMIQEVSSRCMPVRLKYIVTRADYHKTKLQVPIPSIFGLGQIGNHLLSL